MRSSRLPHPATRVARPVGSSRLDDLVERQAESSPAGQAPVRPEADDDDVPF
jgi:hypothetical protein